MLTKSEMEEVLGMKIPGSQISPADMEEVQDPAEAQKKIESYLAAGRHENRCKMLLIQDEFILGVLNFHRGEHSFQCLPVGDELPADAIAEAVHYDPSYRGFLVRVWSAEFDIVPPGNQIPILWPMIEGFNMRTMAIVPVVQSVVPFPLGGQWDSPTSIASAVEDCQRILDQAPELVKQISPAAADNPFAQFQKSTDPPQTEHEKQSDFFFKGE